MSVRIFGNARKRTERKPEIRGKVTFNICRNWVEFYSDACEELPYDMPEPSGELAALTCFVNADHSLDKVTCPSVTIIFLLLHNTLIAWLSKCQKMVKMSTYGSELIAARITIDLIIGMRSEILNAWHAG
jgi:hypothetical protein